MVASPSTNELPEEPAARFERELRRPLTTVRYIRRGIWKNVEEGRNVASPIISDWVKLRENLETKTLTSFDQWPADLKQVGRPLKNRAWKKAYRSLSFRRLFNQINWRVLTIRFQTAFLWVAHILKLTILVLLWIGVPAFLLYGGWLLLSYVWGLFFGGPISSGGV